jgi:hypothetical protein
MARPAESVVDGSKARQQDSPGVESLLAEPVAATLVADHSLTLVEGGCRRCKPDVMRTFKP